METTITLKINGISEEDFYKAVAKFYRVKPTLKNVTVTVNGKPADVDNVQTPEAALINDLTYRALSIYKKGGSQLISEQATVDFDKSVAQLVSKNTNF